jgi:dipeptidyl aminopeptidase
MPRARAEKEEETELLTKDETSARTSEDDSRASVSSISTTSLVLEHINDPSINSALKAKRSEKYTDDDDEPSRAQEQFDVEGGRFQAPIAVDKKTRRWLWARHASQDGRSRWSSS